MKIRSAQIEFLLIWRDTIAIVTSSLWLIIEKIWQKHFLISEWWEIDIVCVRNAKDENWFSQQRKFDKRVKTINSSDESNNQSFEYRWLNEQFDLSILQITYKFSFSNSTMRSIFTSRQFIFAFLFYHTQFTFSFRHSSVFSISARSHNFIFSVSQVSNDSHEMTDQWLRKRRHNVDSFSLYDIVKFFEMKLKRKLTIFVNNNIENKFYINMKYWRDLISMFRKYIHDVFVTLIFKFSEKIRQDFVIDELLNVSKSTIDSFISRDWKQFSLIIVDVLKFFEVKLSKKSTISLNNNTRDRIYLNVKMLNDLISMLDNRIDEIFTIFKFIIVNSDDFVADWEISKNEKLRQIQSEYLRNAELVCETIERTIRAVRQIAHNLTKKKRKQFNERISNSNI